MKLSGFSVMIFLVSTALMFFALSGYTTNSKISELLIELVRANKDLDMSLTRNGDGSSVTTMNRKLKEKRGNSGTVILDDYRPIDPVPSSKASVKPGPIEHGAPIIPYIPRPSPPDPPIG